MTQSEERIQEMLAAHEEIERRKAAAKKQREDRVAGACLLLGVAAGVAVYAYLRCEELGGENRAWWSCGAGIAVAVVLNMIARATPEQLLLTGILLKK